VVALDKVVQTLFSSRVSFYHSAQYWARGVLSSRAMSVRLSVCQLLVSVNLRENGLPDLIHFSCACREWLAERKFPFENGHCPISNMATTVAILFSVSVNLGENSFSDLIIFFCVCWKWVGEGSFWKWAHCNFQYGSHLEIGFQTFLRRTPCPN